MIHFQFICNKDRSLLYTKILKPVNTYVQQIRKEHIQF